jgi:uncharacterized protein involved in exopolysaccharide biosynthesis
MENEINLRDYLEVVAKRWYLVLVSMVIAALLIGLPSISKKSLYEAKAALLLKGQNNAQQLGGIQNILGVVGITKKGEDFPILLQSRAVATKVLDDLSLTKRIKGWDAPQVKKQNLVSAVQNMVKFSDKGGLFEIKAVTDDPALSTDVANVFAQAGADLWNKLNYTEARKKREYIESQLPRVDSDLRNAELALKKFSLISPNDLSLQGIEFKRLEREYLIQDAIYTMLKKEYASAKIDESKEIEPFSMIDPAEKPLKPMKSNIPYDFAIGAIMGSLIGIFLAFGIEYWERSGR